MKHLIMSLLMVVGLLGEEVKEESKFNISGKVMFYYADDIIDLSDGKKIDTIIYYTSTQLNVDYTNDNFYFQVTPYVYMYDTNHDEEIIGINTLEPFEKYSLFFRSLYISYTINNWSIGIGVLPFSNSVPMKFSDDAIQNGVGLNTLNDNALTSIFATYNTRNSKTIFGVGSMNNEIVDTGNHISDNLREGTKVYFVINDYINDKWAFTNELMYIDTKYNSQELSDIYLYGLGVSWDDSAESGLVVYNVAAVSIYQNHSTSAKDEIYTEKFSDNPYGLDGITYGNIIQQRYPDSFAINNETYYGASNLVGLRYEMDLFPLETFINVEWFRTFGDWSSGNQGNIYNGKINQMLNIRDNSYYINYGILTSKNSLLRLTYSYLEINETGKIGAPASTIPSDEFLGGNRAVVKKIQAVHLMFTYKF